MRARPLLAVATLAGALTGCAPRQAVVETDPRSGQETRDRLEALARTDLDRLRRAQGVHFSEEGTYTYELVVLAFDPSPGIDVTVLEATPAGFSALARGGSVECAIFVGEAAPPRSYSTTAGTAQCRPRP